MTSIGSGSRPGKLPGEPVLQHLGPPARTLYQDSITGSSRLTCGAAMRRLHTAPTRELWTSNLVDAARAVGETEHQQSRWLAPDRFAWERPEELINTISDEFLLELYIEEYGKALPRAQTEAVTALRDELNHYCERNTKSLDPCRCLLILVGRLCGARPAPSTAFESKVSE